MWCTKSGDVPSLAQQVVVREIGHGNYDDALAIIDDQLQSKIDCVSSMGLLELKIIILRLCLKCEGDLEGFGPTTKSKAILKSFTYQMLQNVQSVMRCKTHYEVLGVKFEVTVAEVKNAYKRQAVVIHPDKNDAPLAKEAFFKLGQAADTLSHIKLRKKYNKEIGVKKCDLFALFGANDELGPPLQQPTEELIQLAIEETIKIPIADKIQEQTEEPIEESIQLISEVTQNTIQQPFEQFLKYQLENAYQPSDQIPVMMREIVFATFTMLFGVFIVYYVLIKG